MRIRAVLLDLDGTLVEPASTTTFLVYVCKRLGLPFTFEQILEAQSRVASSWITDFADYRLWTRDAFITVNQKFLTQIGAQGDLQTLAERMQEYWDRYPDEVNEQIYPEVRSVLQTLRGMNITLGLVSHRHRLLSLASLKRHGIEEDFACVISPQLAGAPKGKLNPEMWDLALRQVGARPREVLHVDDDYEIGIRGAQRMGIRAILIDRNGRFQTARDCEVIHELTELLDVLNAAHGHSS